MRDSLAGKGQVNYSDLTDAEVSDLEGAGFQLLGGKRFCGSAS